MRNVPVGFAHHKTMMPSYTMDGALEEMDRYEGGWGALRTAGGGILPNWYAGEAGNHFIELQEEMTTVIWL